MQSELYEGRPTYMLVVKTAEKSLVPNEWWKKTIEKMRYKGVTQQEKHKEQMLETKKIF